jgi:Mor family transcriptional regulator
MVKNQKPLDLITETYQPNENDIIDDILRRVIAMAPSFSAALAAQIDKEARQQWGGDRPYIGIRPGTGHSGRNAAIKRDYQAGESIPLLERRYGLGKSRIWEIIKSEPSTRLS